MEYISVKEASKLWNIDPSNIGKLLRKGKIEGAKIVARNWLIPKNSPKPIDGRTKAAKENIPSFRFPLLANFPEDSFVPPLSQEEVKLRAAQIDFYACEFEKSKNTFEKLAEDAESIYVKICAHFYMCVLSAVYDININWEEHYYSFNVLLTKNFPYKKEMEIFSPLLDLIIGQFDRIREKLNTDFSYEYHPSTWYMNALLSVFNFERKNTVTMNAGNSEPFETLCLMMEKDGYYIEAQQLHAILFMHHFGLYNEKMMQYHLNKILDIAYKHNFFYIVADVKTYYSDTVNKALFGYPNSFAELIHKNSKITGDNFSKFTTNISKSNIYEKLSQSDYPYVFYAIEGFPNKQVANICGVSERTVAKRYNDIYDKLGIFSKQELINQMNIAFGHNK